VAAENIRIDVCVLTHTEFYSQIKVNIFLRYASMSQTSFVDMPTLLLNLTKILHIEIS
jgi:hypothetical protein